MGNNNTGGASSEAAKVMKIDGELFKFKTPAKVFDVIKDYPDHVLLDSVDFLRFKLRAKPLDPQHELKPKGLYLLVQLPEPPKTLRRARSSAHERPSGAGRRTRGSVSDVSFMTQSTAISDSDDVVSAGATRVKIRLRKAVVEKIMEESSDDDEVAERILRLCLEESADETGRDTLTPVVEDGGSGGEGRESGEEGAVDRSCFGIHALCSPCIYQRNKYKRLPSM